MAVTLGFKKPPPGGTDYMPTPPVPPGGTDAGAAPAAPAGGNFMTPENINQGLANLNFGQAPPPVPVPTIAPVPGLGGPPPPPPPGLVPTAQQAPAPAAAVGGVPQGFVPAGASAAAGQASATLAAPTSKIVAPRVTAEQGGFKVFEALQQAMYGAQFDPVRQELTRQQGLADEQLKAQLAQSGLARSGTGIGRVGRLGARHRPGAPPRFRFLSPDARCLQ